MPPASNPLPEPMLTQFYAEYWKLDRRFSGSNSSIQENIDNNIINMSITWDRFLPTADEGLS